MNESLLKKLPFQTILSHWKISSISQIILYINNMDHVLIFRCIYFFHLFSCLNSNLLNLNRLTSNFLQKRQTLASIDIFNIMIWDFKLADINFIQYRTDFFHLPNNLRQLFTRIASYKFMKDFSINFAMKIKSRLLIKMYRQENLKWGSGL